MQKMYTPARFIAILVIVAMFLTVFVSALYRIQVYTPFGQAQDDASQQRIITRRNTITAARGSISDRNGILLASGRPSYNIKIDWRMLRRNPDFNDIVLGLIHAATEEGLTYTDTFPVTRRAPFEFIPNMTTAQRNRLDAYLEFYGLDPDIDVSDLLDWMRNNYGICHTIGILDARLIIGVRYELEIRAIVGTIPSYIFASDVSTNFISYLNERGFVGVFSESTYVREYHTTYAAHMIGYTGAMTAEEFEYFRHLGYPMDATVGKVGAEHAFESLLQGRNGEEVIRFTENGTIISHEIITEPQPGNHIYLTMDLNLQRATEHALRTQIEMINLERLEYEEDTIPGGAVVVVNVNTGEVLAAASYPTFNLQTLAQDYAVLNSDTAFPLLNRVTHGRYAPGSTFKMVTALAGLRHNIIFRYTPIYDRGVYDAWEEQGFVARCWIHRETGAGHGYLDVVQALARSCNYFFLAIADRLPGVEQAAYILADTAKEFGLGINTGIELRENSGRLATPGVKRALLDEGWWPADTLLAGFGQGLNRFTPLQLASYSATIATRGTLYSLSFLRRIYSSAFEVLHEHTPEIISVIPETEMLDIIHEGMVAASRGAGGTARPIFGDYDIVVASKTGTVQIEGQAFNDGMFVAYAPASNPTIAVAVIVEKGGSGSAIMDIARMIFDHYFMDESSFLVMPYGQMIP